MTKETIEPRQQRSIEKKKKILESGYKLICERGYYNTNTAQIAQDAGVSSGIVYRYFKDKKDIFLQACQMMFSPLFKNLYYYLENINSKDEIKEIVPIILMEFINIHNLNEQVVRELMALRLLDKDFSAYRIETDLEITDLIEKTLIKVGFTDNIKEKSFMLYEVFNDLCDKYCKIRDQKLNFDVIYNYTLQHIYNIIGI